MEKENEKMENDRRSQITHVLWKGRQHRIIDVIGKQVILMPTEDVTPADRMKGGIIVWKKRLVEFNEEQNGN